ncbi:hypothetical protein D3C86_1751270 [compost metagenome]
MAWLIRSSTSRSASWLMDRVSFWRRTFHSLSTSVLNASGVSSSGLTWLTATPRLSQVTMVWMRCTWSAENRRCPFGLRCGTISP